MDYCIRFIDLPYDINGITVEDADGFYNVYINTRISYYEQQKAVVHELTHIARDDFYSDKKLEIVETM